MERFDFWQANGCGASLASIPRTAGQTPGGVVVQRLNRDVGRMRVFDKREDYEVLE
jgi:hypothetical protein